ncbi:hypothetical protein PR202_ga15440 [Eleusine coracana subsp. coracana]|uniref:Uncharacterized protein n=1 Tax=Eleusine coracana subsp. coracana TaxID=191504 RepID=A0AAV5CIY9_ELECO|nr:hypothetical protein PR202_ga15440 [Eleusine coracana subsp. coracana]
MAEQEDGGRRRREAAGPCGGAGVRGGSSKAEEWGGGAGVVQEGDVVEAVRVDRGAGDRARAALELEAPFKGGRAGLHKALHAAFKRGDTCVEVRVRGGRELQACIVPHHAAAGGGRKQYVLRSMHDPNYLLGFVDRLECECEEFQARLWYSCVAGELLLEIPLEEGDTRLGFAISRTDEGFIYISSVVNDDKENEAPSTRSGLRDLFNRAEEASKLLVISRVSNEKVLPWIISSSGAVRCYDTITLSQKLSLHRLAVRPIQLHLLAWEKPNGPAERTMRSLKLPPPSVFPQPHQNPMPSIEPKVDVEDANVGDLSFRIEDLSFESSWV